MKQEQGTACEWPLGRGGERVAPWMARAALNEENTIRRILVPTDFSPCAEKALRQAVRLARDWAAAITLLYVIDLNLHTPPTGPADSEQIKISLWQEGLGQLGQRVLELAGRGVEVQTQIREGLPREAIAKAARDHDLIVIGRRNRSIWSLFARHTVKGVLEAAPCPVLVVREEKRAH